MNRVDDLNIFLQFRKGADVITYERTVPQERVQVSNIRELITGSDDDYISIVISKKGSDEI